MTFYTQFLHFDTANSTYIYDKNNTAGKTLTPYKTQFTMNQYFRNVKRVYLKSVEMPVGFANVRTGSTDTFIFSMNGTSYTCVLPEKTYTTIGTLLSDLNTIIATKSLPCTMVLSLSLVATTPMKLVITFTGTMPTSFNITDTNFSKYVLGFRAIYDNSFVSGGSYYNATYANYNLNADNYILMYIPTLNSLNASMSGQQSTFKIPLNSETNLTYFYFDGSSFTQFVDITDSGLNFSNITVILYDKFGNNMNPNGADYSFTFAIEIWDKFIK
jgi:hypothetical protein